MQYLTLQAERHRVLRYYFEDLATVMGEESLAFSYADLIARLGLCSEDLDETPGRLSFDHYLSALRILEEEARIPALGARLGLLKRCSTFGFAGLVFLTQSTMSQASQFGHDAFELCFGHYLRLSFSLDDTWMISHYEASPPSLAQNVSLIEQAVMTGVRVQSEVLPRVDWSACEARFAFKAPAYADQYAKYIPFTCTFEQPFNELRVPRPWGDIPSPMADEGVRHFCEERLKARLKEEFRHSYLERQIRRILTDAPSDLLPKLPEIAALLEMPERSLRAKLAMEGTSFRAIQNSLMIDRAKQLLAEPGLSIKEIAFSLGFAEPPCFNRAFLKATGLAPERYRSQFTEAPKP
ncbi:MAG: putative AraC family transcriptional regulator [Holophagaceae bacterium]|nr:putative AraC family transcriptional regulator [Holophagaceae bacterium]